MHRNYKIDEKVLKEIIARNVKSVSNDERINVIFYYKNLKTVNLVMRNNLMTNSSPLCRTNVIYEFICPLPHCKAENYIGMTQTTVSRRLSYHAQSGSILKHFTSQHNSKPTREILVNNTNIVTFAENRYKLAIKEALLIQEKSPSINKQYDNFVNILKLNTRRAISTLNNATPIALSNCESFKTDAENTFEMPNLSTVLQKFGILYKNLREVPIDEYNWNKFDNYMETDVDDSMDNCTISQRIRSLRRRAQQYH